MNDSESSMPFQAQVEKGKAILNLRVPSNIAEYAAMHFNPLFFALRRAQLVGVARNLVEMGTKALDDGARMPDYRLAVLCELVSPEEKISLPVFLDILGAEIELMERTLQVMRQVHQIAQLETTEYIASIWEELLKDVDMSVVDALANGLLDVRLYGLSEKFHEFVKEYVQANSQHITGADSETILQVLTVVFNNSQQVHSSRPE
jgi:hypothetical protein